VFHFSFIDGREKNFGYSCPAIIFYLLTKEASEKNNSLASKRKFRRKKLAKRTVTKTYTIQITYHFNSNDATDLTMQNATIERHESRMQQGYPEQIGGVEERIVMDSFASV